MTKRHEPTDGANQAAAPAAAHGHAAAPDAGSASEAALATHKTATRAARKPAPKRPSASEADALEHMLASFDDAAARGAERSTEGPAARDTAVALADAPAEGIETGINEAPSTSFTDMAAPSPVDSMASTPSVASALSPAAPPGSAGSVGGLSMGTIALGALAVGAVGIYALSKGSSTVTNANANATPDAQKFSVSVVAGPVKEPVQVEAFDKDGKLVASAVSDADGNALLSFAAGFSGPLLIKATGLNGAGIMHLAEASGVIESLNAPLRAMVVIDGHTQNISITPLTELAAQKMGLTGDNAALSADTINKTSAAVARLFGLDSLSGPVTTVVDAKYSAADGIDMSERYGQQLAAVSGADAATGSGAATIDKLAASIDLDSATMSTAGSDLLTIGRDVFASGQNAAFATLVAASLPLLPTISNSAAASAALAAGAAGDGKVDADEAALGMDLAVALPSNTIAGDTVKVTLGDAQVPTGAAPVQTHAITLREVATGYATVSFTPDDLLQAGDGLKQPKAVFTNASGDSAPATLGTFVLDAPPEQDVILPPPKPTSFPLPVVALAPGQDSTLNGKDIGISLIVKYDGIQDSDLLQPMRNGEPFGTVKKVSNREQRAGQATVPITLAELGADGLLAIGVVATNTIGTAARSNDLSIKLDATAPSLTLASVPVGDEYVNSKDGNFVFKVSYPDMEAGDLVTLTIADGTGAPTLLAPVYQVSQSEASAKFFDYPATLAQLGGDGVKTITAVATDTNANVSAPVSLQVTVDQTVPMPVMALAAGDHFINRLENGVQMLVSTVGMASGDIIQIRSQVDPTDPLSASNRVLATKTVTDSMVASGNASVTIEVDKASFTGDGTYQLYAVEKDKAGNVGASGTVQIDLDTNVPEPRLALKQGEVNLVNSLNNGLDFEVGYEGMKSGDTVQMMSGSTALGPAHPVVTSDVNDHLVRIALSASDMLGDTLADPRLIRAVVTDEAGNVNGSAQMRVTIDTTVPQPSVALTSGAASATLSGASPTTQVRVSYSGMKALDVIELESGVRAITGKTHSLTQSEANSGHYDFTVAKTDFTGSPGDTFSIYATATDSAHNAGLSTTSATVVLG